MIEQLIIAILFLIWGVSVFISAVGSFTEKMEKENEDEILEDRFPGLRLYLLSLFKGYEIKLEEEENND